MTNLPLDALKIVSKLHFKNGLWILKDPHKIEADHRYEEEMEKRDNNVSSVIVEIFEALRILK